MRNKAAATRPAYCPRHTLTHILFLLSFLLSLAVGASAACYAPNGNELSVAPCQGSAPNSDLSGMCCGLGDECLVNGLCYQTASDTIYRGGCTDPDWKNCARVCWRRGECSDALDILAECPDRPGIWYCGMDDQCGIGKDQFVGRETCRGDNRAQAGLYSIPDLDRKHLTAWPAKPSSSSTSSSSAETHPTTTRDAPKPTTPTTTASVVPLDPPGSPDTSKTAVTTLPGSESADATSAGPAPSVTMTADPGMAQSPANGTPSPTASDAPAEENDGRNIPIAIGSTFGGLIVIASGALVFFYVRKRKRESPARAESPPGYFYEPEMSIYGNQGGRQWPWKKR
ncbi:hypothetical protein QBC34DRAFT_28692 [Podospora aff. communis PSN243]|uniref:Mid2 domain-containing protein n=1 Tax=Podospora aff. communis PSN243 TaxID=3040156 RepID=A0AAV9GUT0_9PEZI|nr:hypothetical protein QBC34DRAFT_28692 [Podospora aff. communis PSN243]